MSVKERMRLSLLIEEIEGHKVYGKRLGLENNSRLHGLPVDAIKEKDGNEL